MFNTDHWPWQILQQMVNPCLYYYSLQHSKYQINLHMKIHYVCPSLNYVWPVHFPLCSSNNTVYTWVTSTYTVSRVCNPRFKSMQYSSQLDKSTWTRVCCKSTTKKLKGTQCFLVNQKYILVPWFKIDIVSLCTELQNVSDPWIYGSNRLMSCSMVIILVLTLNLGLSCQIYDSYLLSQGVAVCQIAAPWLS